MPLSVTFICLASSLALARADDPWYVRCGQGIPQQVISPEGSVERAASADVAVSTWLESGGQGSAGQDDLPQVDAADLSLGGDVADISRVNEMLAKSPLSAVVIRRAFDVEKDIPLSLLADQPGTYSLNNGFYGYEDVNGEAERKLAESCSVPATAPFRNRARKCDHVQLKDYFSDDVQATDFHMFYATRGEADEPSCYWPQHTSYPPGSIFETLAQAVLGDSPRNTTLGRNMREALRSGHRPMATAMRPATSIGFHSHSATWFGLTHGRKAWWLGPPRLAAQLKKLGSDESAQNSCQYLQQPPHPELTFFVQEPGDIIIFGEQVPHATCALLPSMGLGNQMGFYAERYLNLLESPRCVGSLDAAHCETTPASGTAGTSNLFLARKRQGVATEASAGDDGAPTSKSHQNKKPRLRATRRLSFLQIPVRSRPRGGESLATTAAHQPDELEGFCAA